MAVCLFEPDGDDLGESALRAFAELLRCQTRIQDILCHYKERAFAVILRGVCSPEAIERKARDICREYRARVGFTCASGIAIAQDPQESIQELMLQAEQSMFCFM